MSMVIANNIPAVNTKRQFATSARGLSGAMEKLSSGYKINTGKDDPAGLVISEQLRSQLNGLKRAQQNTEEAINVLGIAEGALNEMNNILKKMKALAIHSANNGITSPEQVAADQAEMDSAIQTLDRIAQTTKFSDQYMLNGQKDITYEQNTLTKGTQQNSLVNARESEVVQIFKRDGFSVALNFTGTTNPNNLTGTGDTDFSQQAMKPYLEIDTARGSSTAQVDKDGNFTQQQQFTLTGTKGSRTFKFKQGSSVADMVQQVHSSADSTGIDAALIFNSAQRIDKLGNGNGEFAPMVENKFKLDGLVNEKGESLYLSVSYDEKNKDNVNLDAFANGMNFQVAMNDELDVYGMPTYKVTLGNSTLIEKWDGKADTFNGALASITANNTNPGDEFAMLKYMNVRVDTDIDPRESFKDDDVFEFSSATLTFDNAPADFIGAIAGEKYTIDISGMDPAKFLGGAGTVRAETKANDKDNLYLSVTIDGIEHTATVPLADLFGASSWTAANDTHNFIINQDAVLPDKRINVDDNIFDGLKIVITDGGAAFDPTNVAHTVGASSAEALPASTTVGLDAAKFGNGMPIIGSSVRLTKENLDNVPERPVSVAKPVMPRALVDKPVDPATLPPLVAPTQPVDPHNGGAVPRPTSETQILNVMTATGLKDSTGADILFNIAGNSADANQAQQYLDELRKAIGDKNVRLDFEANGNGSAPGSTTYKVSLIVSEGADSETFVLNNYWNGNSTTNIVYSNDDDTSEIGKALKNVRFNSTLPVDKEATLYDKLDYKGLLGNCSYDGLANDTVSVSAGSSHLDIDFSKMTHADWNTFLSDDMKKAIANGDDLKVSATLNSASAANGTLVISVEVGGHSQSFLPLAVAANETGTKGLQWTDSGGTTHTFTGIDIGISGIDGTNWAANTTAGTAKDVDNIVGKTTWLGGVKPTAFASTMDKSAFDDVVAKIDEQKAYDEVAAQYQKELAEYNVKNTQYQKDLIARNTQQTNYPAALAAWEADQRRLTEDMKVYNAELKDYNIYRENVLKYEAGSNVVKNGIPLGTDLVPDPGAIVGGVAIGDEAESVARNVGTVAVFNNELDPDGSGKVIRGVQGVAMSDEAADSIHYGKNTDGQGRVFVKFLDDNSFELYKDASLSAESLVATGINGREIKEANNSGLKGLTLNLAKDAGGDLPAVKGVYIALAGIEGRSTNVDKDGNSYDGVIYDKDVVNTPRTVEKIATQEDVDAGLAAAVGDKFKTQTYEGSGCFDADRTLITGVELGRNTSEEGKIYLKNMYDAKTGTMQVFAYKNEKMRDEDMVAKSEIYKVTGDDGTDASSITVVLNEVRLMDKTEGTGLGIVLSVDAAAFKGVETSTLTGAMQFTNLGARVFAQDYGSGSVLKITQDKGAIFSYYQSPGVDTSKRVIAAGDKATTVELKGQDATLSINGAQVFTDGLKLNMANQDLQANFVFNKGKVGSTTLAQVGYDDGSIFTKAGALNVGSAEANEDGISGQLCNAGHTTNEKLDSFQGGMQMQLGEGSGDQNRTVVAIKSLTADNLGRVSKSGYWETGSAVYTEKMFTMKDVMGGGFACLRTDPVLAMSIIEVAINDVAEVRAQIGAMQANLLQTNSNNLSVTMENIQKTESGIRDADMADEMTEFTKNQVLQSAATSMLANANQSSQNVLQLLQ